MRDVARRPMENGAIIRLHATGDGYDLIADQVVRPTSELPSHLAMHDYMRSVRGMNTKVVCHTHPTDLIALTHHERFLQPHVLGRMLWSMIPETRIIVPRGVGIVPYEIPGSLELADATLKALADHDVVMWEKHGCLAVGEDVIETFDMIDTLSKSAQIYLHARVAGFEPEGMSKAQLEGLVPVFNLPPWAG
jgi:rhamnulose-1-phosphate aldolase